MASYIHPSVSSRIIDNSVVFLSATGLTNLFAVFTADKGPDREPKYITTEDEFKFLYGEPNVRRHGQTAYNIVNWLRANGGVWCLRVTADGSEINDVLTKPATYANTAFVIKSRRESTTFVAPTYTIGQRQEVRLTVSALASGVIAGAPVPYSATWSLKFRLVNVSATATLKDLRTLLDSSGVATFGSVPYEVPVGSSAAQIASQVAALFNVMADTGGSTFYTAKVDPTDASTVQVEYKQKGQIVGSPQFNPGILAGSVNDVLDIIPAEVTSTKVTQVAGGESYPSKLVVQNDSKSVNFSIDLSNGLKSSDIASRINSYITANSSLPFVVATPYVSGDRTVTIRYNNPGVPEPLTVLDNANSGAEVRFSVTVAGKDKEWNTGMQRYRWLADADASGFRILDNSGTPGAVFTAPVEGNVVDLSSYSANLGKILEKGKSLAAVLGALKAKNANAPTLGSDYEHYLFAVLPRGRGAFYNNLGYRLVPNFDLVGTYPEFVLYNFDVVELYRGSEVVRESFVVSLSPDAISTSRESLHIADVVNRYSRYLEVAFNEDAYEYLGDQISGATPLNPDLLDVVSFRPIEEVKVQYRSAGNGKLTTVVLDVVEQNKVYTNRSNFSTAAQMLVGGSDGTLESTKTADRAQVMALSDKIIASGYAGAIVPVVADKRSVEIDVLLDAGHSLVVKNAISDFTSKTRQDCIAFLDTGFTASPAEALEVRKTLPATRYAAIFAQDFVVTDEFTGRDEKFTSTYFLSSKIASNDELNGISMNFVGPRRGGISGFKTMSWNPTPVQKDALYKAQVNYCESDASGTIFATQLTSQRQNSAMSNISMVRTILRMQREAEALCAGFRMEYGNPETFKQLQVQLGNTLYKYVRSGAVKTLNCKVYA